MKPVSTVRVVPAIPSNISRLTDLANNLRWSWCHESFRLFLQLDWRLWDEVNHNPIRLLGGLTHERLVNASQDPAFLQAYHEATDQLDSYLQSNDNWYESKYGIYPGYKPGEPVIAYFSAEFGITECLSIFAGGLGILAGDHLKSASDLGVPLVGIGLFYQQGYFKQRINEAGWQTEIYENNDFHTLPTEKVLNEHGSPVLIDIDMPSRKVYAQIWKVQVGRVPLYLLDTNVEMNQPADRGITFQLYGGDREMRIQQEILLGIGGVRAIRALGLRPIVMHMNEGHCAFAAIERLRMEREQSDLTVGEARVITTNGMVFTTHTPEAAGHDYFDPNLVRKYFTTPVNQAGSNMDAFLGLGRVNPRDPNEFFCMTVLALKLAAFTNGVARLHGVVSRQMWHGIWPTLPIDEVPIGSVTNGVHYETWVSPQNAALYDQYIGPKWRAEPWEVEPWSKVTSIPNRNFWDSRQQSKHELIQFVRSKIQTMDGVEAEFLPEKSQILRQDVLTIGFARRFAPYKRATLLLHDLDRLDRLINNPQRPMQFVFSGKAHPHDDSGRNLIQQIINASRQERFRGKIVFVDNYDLGVARYLVQGCDIWLNNPVRPREASGTSGMKAAINGTMNVSTLDGWWDEAYRDAKADDVFIGWAIGNGEEHPNPDDRDRIESQALYNVLEHLVAPLYYDRNEDNIPDAWLTRMKTSIARLGPMMSSHRMVQEYASRFYPQLADRHTWLHENNYAETRALAVWKDKIVSAWPALRVESLIDPEINTKSGDTLRAHVLVSLGNLAPEDVAILAYIGQVDSSGQISTPADTIQMTMTKHDDSNKTAEFQADVPLLRKGGVYGIAFKAIPTYKLLGTSVFADLVTWA